MNPSDTTGMSLKHLAESQVSKIGYGLVVEEMAHFFMFYHWENSHLLEQQFKDEEVGFTNHYHPKKNNVDLLMFLGSVIELNCNNNVLLS